MGFFGGFPSFSAPVAPPTSSFTSSGGGLSFPGTTNVSGFSSPTQTPFASFNPNPVQAAPPAQGGGFGGGLGFDKILGSLSQLGGLFGGQRQGSNAALIKAQQQAAAFEANARLFDLDAAAFLDTATKERDRELRRSKIRVGEARSKFLKGGVTLQGSPLVVLGDLALEGSLDAEILFHEGQVRAQQARNKATVERFNAQQALAAGSLLADG